MKYLILLSIVALLMGCSTDNMMQPQTLDTISSQQKNDHPATVPFYGVYDTKATLGQTMITNTGEGHATHLGESTVTAIHTYPNPNFSGTVEFVSASGAKLVGDLSGTSQAPDANGIARFSGDVVIAGGTGRFVNASGHLYVAGWVDFSKADLSGQVEYKGHIQYASVQVANN
jgi:hypothetical protein